MTKEEIEHLEAFTQAAQPLMDWLKEQCHPHVTVIVNHQCAKILDDLATVRREKNKEVTNE